MAAIVSPWAKPGAWALESEEQEAELLHQQQQNNPSADVSAVDFPSLTAAATTKPSKKKKGQTISLAEFSSYSSALPSKRAEPARGLTTEDLLILPTGPRERTAEELDRNRLGGGFKSYGSGRYGDESGNNRRGGFDESRRREPPPPSRADEIDDWAAGKKSVGVGSNGFDRRERSSGFFNSQSKADESDNWGSNKSMEIRRSSNGSSDFGRERRGFRGGFEGSSNGGGADSDRWGRRSHDEVIGGEADRWGRKSQDEGGADSDRWSRRTQDEGTLGNSSRPKLVLQPRTLPVIEASGSVKPKGSSPFGDARPREEVLKEKGQDWKEIDEKLETVRIKEEKSEGSLGKKGLGSGNGNGNGRINSQDDRTERSWRKTDSNSAEDAAPSAENVENGVEENPSAEAKNPDVVD